MDDARIYMARQAKELICVNVSDLSGAYSKSPHTILAATYLTGSNLKQVVRECFTAAQDLLESNNVSVLNYAVDGESLFLVQTHQNGMPGNDLSLAKSILVKLKSFSKNELVSLVAENANVKITSDLKRDSDDEVEVSPGDFEIVINESLHTICTDKNQESFTQEDIEYVMRKSQLSDIGVIEKRRMIASSLRIEELRHLCLKAAFPSLKKVWLQKCYGADKFVLALESENYTYSPSSVFLKNNYSHFITITFDTAHICNLLRESAAKGRLEELGLKRSSLQRLAENPKYSFLKRILSLKGGSLEYDPMNQKSSEQLLSQFVEVGLEQIGDYAGAQCISLLRGGILESMDVSGIGSGERCRKICLLKEFLNTKIDMFDKLKRSGAEEITPELYQMINFTLDSHIITYLNLEYFNPRRKSTGTVEQFFSQITLMNDGGFKLTCRVLQDILHRVMITNALRLLPDHVKGFSFLKHLNIHMTSYTYKPDKNHCKYAYPQVKKNDNSKVIHPVDSEFDYQKNKRRTGPTRLKEVSVDTGSVRKYFKKF